MPGELFAQVSEQVRAYGHARARVVGYGLFERLHRRERGGLGAARSVKEALRSRIDARQLPERVAPIEAETGQRADVGERLELGATKLGAGDEIGERDEGRGTARGSMRRAASSRRPRT